MSDTQPISITILDKEYKIACPPGEQSALLASAKYLDVKMREIRDSGSIIGSERIAVITALNIANELLAHSTIDKSLTEKMSPRLKNIETKIMHALEQTRQLKI
ncbi:MAG: cell division protein ZapA [Gammaproteobacteria bacterium]|jgi:cell division protein ZapA